MTVSFWLAAAAMLLAAIALVMVLPRYWGRRLEGESTADWVRLRREELAGAEGQLLDEVDLRALEDLGTVAPGDRTVSTRPLPVLWLPMLLVAASVGLYLSLGGLEDVRITERLVELDPEQPEQVVEVIAAIEERVRERPDNADYLSLLGQYHAASGDHAAAFRAYDRLATLMPENPEVLGRAAQSEFLSAGRVLSKTARSRAEKALAADPEQRAALGALGMAAFEANDYPAAIRYWERMLVLEPPGSPSHQMLQGVVDEARARAEAAGLAVAASPPVENGLLDPPTAGLTIEISTPEAADIPPASTVFILARPTGATSRMPTAVTRRDARAWPLRVVLTDADAMAGQQLSALESVTIEVQVSPTGQPGLSNASWTARADNVVPSDSAVVSLVLSPVTR